MAGGIVAVRFSIPVSVCVYIPMARAAENDKIFLGVISQLAAPSQVMDLEVGFPAAVLALPAVTLQDPLKQFLVRGAVQLQSGAPWRRISHW